MNLNELKPRKALNKAFLKVKPNRTEIEGFKTNLITLLDRTNDTESEEFHKNLISDFLKKTYYDPNHFINTKGRNDLVIHNGQNANTTVGVIIEAKKPTNKAEMISTKKLNAKAFQELVLYYLRERITHKNLEIKHLVATNINEWFIFDEHLFERLFAQNKSFVKQFENFETSKKTTDVFYKEIAEPFIESITSEIEFTYFNIQDYQKPLRNNDKTDDNALISLFKLLSPEHLLKLPFTNDSNSLDKRFYSELLHIIGLTETKEGSKKLIERNKEGERNTGTILEDAIIQLDSLDKLSRLEKPNQFGNTQQERLFNVALELSITWINRILFLKLLEAQLITYNKGDKSFSFLSLEKIKNYDDLNSLFFQVLARKYDQRNEDVKKEFEKIPYLNSSLFEPTDIEQITLFISNLKDDKTIPIFSQTVLKDQQGKKRTGNIATLQYLFEFLDAYEFGAEGSEEIQEDNKTLINASVLGLIFEKINGYKDGSFFTPGFITMYMCRETIRKAVVQKFNDTKQWNCTTIEELYDKIEDRKEANEIVNSIKICDPAVGSGHFLVSALNEMIAVKNDLKILQDRDGKRLKEYQVEVVNDELIVTDEEGELFEYNPNNKESQRIQETLFHEKQSIIEKCLFGVDINPNSVKICRLRLWIELLKNAYYKTDIAHGLNRGLWELETLPNIDINIKCGNSLVSRFAIDADLKQALKKSKWNIDSYRIAVDTYRNAENKEQKREMEQLIAAIKSDFRSEIETPFKKSLSDARGSAEKLTTKILNLESFGEKADKKLLADHKKAVEKLNKLEVERDETLSNKIFENAFEWRFEFPEVLNDDGDFVGFDVVIGNPPYVYRNADFENVKDYFNSNYYNTSGNYDLYKFFIEQSIRISKENGFNSLITNSSFLLQTSFDKTRKFILDNSTLKNIVPLGGSVFEEATVDSAIYILQKSKYNGELTLVINPQKPVDVAITPAYTLRQSRFLVNEFLVFDYLLNDQEYNIVNKLILNFPKIETAYDFGVGINTGYIKDELTAGSKLDKRYHPMVPGTGVSKYGNIKTEGYIMYDKEFVKSKGKLGRTLPEEKFFTEPKILIVRTRNISLKERIIASIDYGKKYNLNRISNIISKGDNSLEGLLGVLNSKLFNWLYSKRYFDYEIKPIYLRNSPLCDTNDKRLNKLVKEIISLRSSNEKADITSLTDEIDQLVYQLYELTEDEIKIVEGNG
ncbi:DUF7149 domain-containing protein [Pedobacter puniceum]